MGLLGFGAWSPGKKPTAMQNIKYLLSREQALNEMGTFDSPIDR